MAMEGYTGGFRMNIEQKRWTEKEGWIPGTPTGFADPPQLVFVFGDTALLRDRTRYRDIRSLYPESHIIGCSTAGEIYGTEVLDHSIITTAIHFTHTPVTVAHATIKKREKSFEAGKDLARSIETEGLRHVLVLSDGLTANGSALTAGLAKHLTNGVSITGGLSGDDDRFSETLVICDGLPERNRVVIAGFYGDNIDIGYGSRGGWDPFGPERLVTRSRGNILYELDGKSALELYKRYLGRHADDLPATGLLFPLSVRYKNGETQQVRTILSLDEHDRSMTFAGDVPEGACARFMKANVGRLIDGAVEAAEECGTLLGGKSPDLAILISCLGRRMVLKQRVEEEIEGVQGALGEHTVLAGFYSYGEIAPLSHGGPCGLHNQTMTITAFQER